MTQHYQRNVCAISKYCPTCGKMTMHLRGLAEDDRRVSTCTEPHVFCLSKRQKKMEQKKADQERQPGLFEARKK